MTRKGLLWAAWLGALALLAAPQPRGTAVAPAADERAVARACASITAAVYKKQLAWWAADARGGREAGTRENWEAAAEAVRLFRQLGLRPAGEALDGERTYFQHFERGGRWGFDAASCRLAVGGRTFRLGKDYTIPGYTRRVDLQEVPVVFCGYGIRSRRLAYDDYAGVDVKGKAVLIFRHEPQEGDPKSRWNGTRAVPEASFFRKRREALRRGAALLLVVDEPLHHDPDHGKLMLTESFASRRLPVLHLRPRVAAALLAGTGRTLADLQRRIDAADAPASFPLKVKLTFQAERKLMRPARNVLAILPGSDPKLKDEYVVVGAHYDHIGRGRFGTRTPKRRGEVHNGADDNASGTVGVLELAKAFATSGVKLRRSLLFILFDAEEKGLLGSRHFVEHPTVPRDRIVAMINLDMIGHVRQGKCSVSGTGTAKVWAELLAKAERGGKIRWAHRRGYFGGSDHLSFAQKKIPVLFYNSGLHQYYHTPEDDPERCNPEGAVAVLRTVFRLVYLTANLPQRPRWREPTAGASRGVVLGVRVKPDERGARIVRVTPGSAAARAGLRPGDVLVRVGKVRVRSALSLRSALRRAKPGGTLTVEYLREGKRRQAKVTLPKGTPKKEGGKKGAAPRPPRREVE